MNPEVGEYRHSSLERWYRRATRSRDGQGGAVTVMQRFGSSVALNLHFHIVALDGVYVTGGDGRPSFRQATPHQADVEALVEEIWRAAERWLRRQGHPADDDVEPDGEDGSALLQQASLEGLEAVAPRAGRRVRRTQRLGGREMTLPPRCAAFEGYNLHAGVSVQASDRDALVRLLRYTLRPPLAKGRLSEAPDGTVVLELKRAWSDGTWQVSFSRADFVGKLAALVPPPRSNQTVYHGVLAGNACMREAVVPPAPERHARRPRAHRGGPGDAQGPQAHPRADARHAGLGGPPAPRVRGGRAGVPALPAAAHPARSGDPPARHDADPRRAGARAAAAAVHRGVTGTGAHRARAGAWRCAHDPADPWISG